MARCPPTTFFHRDLASSIPWCATRATDNSHADVFHCETRLAAGPSKRRTSSFFDLASTPLSGDAAALPLLVLLSAMPGDGPGAVMPVSTRRSLTRRILLRPKSASLSVFP